MANVVKPAARRIGATKLLAVTKDRQTIGKVKTRLSQALQPDAMLSHSPTSFQSNSYINSLDGLVLTGRLVRFSANKTNFFAKRLLGYLIYRRHSVDIYCRRLVQYCGVWKTVYA